MIVSAEIKFLVKTYCGEDVFIVHITEQQDQTTNEWDTEKNLFDFILLRDSLIQNNKGVAVVDFPFPKKKYFYNAKKKRIVCLNKFLRQSIAYLGPHPTELGFNDSLIMQIN
jgi:hypothetical protein